MKLLNGQEIAGFLKERQAKQVRSLRARKIFPKLAIIQLKDDPVINTYVRLKKQYGADIGVKVEVHNPKQSKAAELLDLLSNSKDTHGIIVQLPLENPAQTDEIVNLVDPRKDVDGLGNESKFSPATPTAILWLLAGYNIELAGKHILIIGRGKLVGSPLEKILKNSGYDVQVIGREAKDLAGYTREADIIITATGSPGILRAADIKQGAVVVDAGVASEEGKKLGDLAADVYSRSDLTVTPPKGGVGPVTVCTLFENVIMAANDAKN